MFLTGTLLNIAAVLLGTSVGLLAGSHVPRRMQESLTTGLGFFVVVIGLSMALRIFTDPAARPGGDLAVLGGLLVGVAAGELLRLHDGPPRWDLASTCRRSPCWSCRGSSRRARSCWPMSWMREPSWRSVPPAA